MQHSPMGVGGISQKVSLSVMVMEGGGEWAGMVDPNPNHTDIAAYILNLPRGQFSKILKLEYGL